jgi:hypothetical protein
MAQPALHPNCFTLLLLSPGNLGGPIPAGDPCEMTFTNGQRNIFRQPWPRRADISPLKTTKLAERVALKYTFDVFDLTNTASFDIPIDSVFLQQFPSSRHDASPTSCHQSLNRGVLCLRQRQRPRHNEQNDWQPAANSEGAQRAVLVLTRKT